MSSISYVSTRGHSPPVSLEEALIAGPAPDGGLYLPSTIERFSPAEVDNLLAQDLVPRSTLILERLLGEPSPVDVESMVAEALDFPIPLVRTEERIAVLELFWGPTLAFKDIAARTMARLLAALRRDQPAEGPTTVIVATSGDTGSAVAHAFFGVPGYRVAVLFPEGLVSEAQQRLFTTLGGNIRALAVDGTFDDCQSLVRQAFSDQTLVARHRLTSANSINIGRLLPQTLFYFEAAAQLSAREREHACFVVPSGNFGDLTAGLIAAELGLPIPHFLAATNRNDGFVRFLENGVPPAEDSRPSLANAMDVGAPSNLERIRALYPDLRDLRKRVSALATSDRQIVETIAQTRERTGYLLDPHTACGYRSARRYLEDHPQASAVVLATAHPAKFSDTVEQAIGQPIDLPAPLARAFEQPQQVTAIPPDLDRLRQELANPWSSA